MAPRPDLRLAAVRVLADAGLKVVVGCAPVMPLINDSETSLDALAREAAAAGAVALWANVLFLKPCAYQVFLPFLEERFPELVRKYRERYDRVGVPARRVSGHDSGARGANPETSRPGS